MSNKMWDILIEHVKTCRSRSSSGKAVVVGALLIAALPSSRIVIGGRLPALLHDSSPVRHSQGSRSLKFLFYSWKEPSSLKHAPLLR
ncbi:hypothetical protein KSP40_PGU000269 [Platanthera guangdongensis]|uniref:Uncharacterized protein n=1 Tax=Platanthera guangdongensis TaxID=2320717 RepID=A0ABR2MWI8_9ASPA